MNKKLTDLGNDLALIIDRPILELLGIDKDTELDIKTDGVGLLIIPVNKIHKKRVSNATERIMDSSKKTLRKFGK